MIILIEPSNILPKQALHVGLSAFDGHAFAQNGPAGKGHPRGEEGAKADIEEDVSVVYGVVKSLLRV